MGIENLSEDVLLVVLPEQPHLSYELEAITEIAGNRGDCDVIIDFFRVEMLTSESVCSLMILNKLIAGLKSQRRDGAGLRLVLCNISSPVRRVFTLTGLETVFTFAKDRLDALEQLGHVPSPVHSQI